MCQSDLHPLLQSLPKCEHHMHMEGALTPDLLFQLAKKNDITLPSTDPAFSDPVSLAKRYREFTSLDDFLAYYYIGMSVLLHVADFEALAWDYFTHASSDGVAHAEVFFDPQAHLSRNVSYDTVLSGFAAARKRAETELGITSELICCFLRHLPPADALGTFELQPVQASFQSREVVGIGLDSSEKDFPPALFQHLYQRAGSIDMRLTAHAGEEGPASFIRSALDDLQVRRIDHGIHLVDDPALIKRISDENIMLSICPISNVFLRCVSSVAELPIKNFLAAGVRFSINSDDPAYFGNNYILSNYCAVQEAFDLTVAEWSTICENSILGSWCSDHRKQEMLAKLKANVQQWETDHAA